MHTKSHITTNVCGYRNGCCGTLTTGYPDTFTLLANQIQRPSVALSKGPLRGASTIYTDLVIMLKTGDWHRTQYLLFSEFEKAATMASDKIITLLCKTGISDY